MMRTAAALRNRRGAALAIALFALVTIGAIAQAVLQPAVANRRAARRIASHHGAESAAERAIADIMGGRPVPWWRALIEGNPADERTRIPVGTSTLIAADVTTRVLRLTATVFSIVAEAELAAPDAPVRVRRSVLVELEPDTVEQIAALTAGGNVSLAADSRVERATGCEVDADTSAALFVTPDAVVRRSGVVLVEGVRRDARAAAPETYASPGGLSVALLAAAAAVTIRGSTMVAPAPVVDGDRCVAGQDNWGDPTGGDAAGPCHMYAPVVVADGDLRVAGGMGQGVLIVTGRLVIAGPFVYSGLIIATGGIATEGGPVTVSGAVFVPPSGSVTFGEGPTVIRASRCALDAAADAASRLRVLPGRGWWR